MASFVSFIGVNFVLAVTLIGNQTMMVPGGIYSLLMFATAGIYLLPIFRREAGE